MSITNTEVALISDHTNEHKENIPSIKLRYIIPQTNPNTSNVIVNPLTQPLSFQQALKKRDKSFIEEYKRMEFSYSTTVEYKTKRLFKQHMLFLNNQKLYILDLPKKHKSPPLLSFKESITFQNFRGFNLRYPVLTLNFDLVTAKLTVDKANYTMTILILGSPRKFEIRIKNNIDVFNTYAYLINSAIVRSEGNKMNLFGVSLRSSNFYKYNYISVDEFEHKAKTGDLLIFKGLECPSPLQRFFTGDEYDHVALLKYNKSTLNIYESSIDTKCCMLEWQRFKRMLYNLVYDKIVYRRLIIEGSSETEVKKLQREIEIKTQEYVDETNKKGYLLSVCPVICWKGPREFEKNNQWKHSKGFSCSGLLTGAYYKMGVMEITQDTRAILPGHYSQSDNTTLVFKKGFSLGPEEILEFST